MEISIKRVDGMEQVFSKRDKRRSRKFGGRLLDMVWVIRALLKLRP